MLRSIPVSQALAQEIRNASRLPNYLNAGWRNVTPVCEQTSRIGLGFDTAAGPVRLAISMEHAAELAHCLAAYIKAFAGSQSCGSGLMPSDPRSVPSDGVNT